MAKSETMKFKGEALWAKVFEDNRDMAAWNDATGAYDLPHPRGGRYSLNLKMEDADFKRLKMTGSVAAKNSKLDMDDGKDIVKLGRDHEKYSAAGALMDWVSGPPKVVKADGTPWDMSVDGGIGNGSTVEVTLDIFKTKFAPRTTLMAVKVLDLVEYNTDDSVPNPTASVEASDQIPF